MEAPCRSFYSPVLRPARVGLVAARGRRSSSMPNKVRGRPPVHPIRGVAKRRGPSRGRMPACPARPAGETPGIDMLIARGDHLPAFDVHAPLMSLPRICGTSSALSRPRCPTSTPTRSQGVVAPPDRGAWGGRGRCRLAGVGHAWTDAVPPGGDSSDRPRTRGPALQPATGGTTTSRPGGRSRSRNSARDSTRPCVRGHCRRPASLYLYCALYCPGPPRRAMACRPGVLPPSGGWRGCSGGRTALGIPPCALIACPARVVCWTSSRSWPAPGPPVRPWVAPSRCPSRRAN